MHEYSVSAVAPVSLGPPPSATTRFSPSTVHFQRPFRRFHFGFAQSLISTGAILPRPLALDALDGSK